MQFRLLVCVLSVSAASIPVALANAQQLSEDVIYSQHHFYIENDGAGIIPVLVNTVKQGNTDEGKLIIGTVLSFVGVDPATTTAGIEAIAAVVTDTQGNEDIRGLIQAPPGYTICYASPVNPNGAYHGIETTEDSSFNTSIMRVDLAKGQNFDGLGWNTVAPHKVGVTVRIDASFEVVFVKAVPGWQNLYKNCEATGEHPWLSRNNETRLRVSP